jgi:hypothetical protein
MDTHSFSPDRESTMQVQKARQILQALIQGVDPFNGEELASGSVLQQPDVMRAMLAGVAALEESAERSARRAQLPDNAGRPWNQEEEFELIKDVQGEMKLQEIAVKHGRTLRAIEARLEKLGLIKAGERATHNRFGK